MLGMNNKYFFEQTVFWGYWMVYGISKYAMELVDFILSMIRLKKISLKKYLP